MFLEKPGIWLKHGKKIFVRIYILISRIKYKEDYKVDGYQWLGQGENKKYPPSNPVCLKTYYDAKTYNQTTKKKRNDARVPEASHQTFER